MMENYAAHLNNSGILDELLSEVALAADALEERIEEHIVDSESGQNGVGLGKIVHTTLKWYFIIFDNDRKTLFLS